jgi:hypothetical protein
MTTSDALTTQAARAADKTLAVSRAEGWADLGDNLACYLRDGTVPSGVLSAILANDLLNAVARADHTTMAHLRSIVQTLFTYVPREAWGSDQKVDDWLRRFRP